MKNSLLIISSKNIFILLSLLCYKSFAQCDLTNVNLTATYVSTVGTGPNCTFRAQPTFTVLASGGAPKVMEYTIGSVKICYTGTPLVSISCTAPNNNFSAIASGSYTPASFLIDLPCETSLVTWQARTQNTGASCASGSINSPLPVKLTTFTAQSQGSVVRLEWSATDEVNFDKFVVQRSEDARTFEDIAELTASEAVNYSFVDTKPATSINYYRLKEVDKDGSFKFSKIISAKVNQETTVVLFPNPTQGNALFINNLKAKDVVSYNVFAKDGKRVDTTLKQHDEHTIALQFIESPATGIYIIKISTKTETITQKLMIK